MPAPIIALLVGGAVVGAVALTSKPPKATGAPPATPGPTTNTPGGQQGTGDLAAIASAQALAGNDPNVQQTQDPTGDNPANVQTVTTDPENGAVTATASSPSQPSGTSPIPPLTPAAFSGNPPTQAPPAPQTMVVNYQAAYNAVYGTASTQADQNGYYAAQTAAGNTIT